MSKHLRSILLIILAVIAVFFIVERFVQPSEGATRLDYGAFYQKLEAGRFSRSTRSGLSAIGDLANGAKYTVAVPNVDQAFVDEVYRKVKSGAISFDQQTNTGLFSSLIGLAPLAHHRLAAVLHFAAGAERRKPGAVVRAFASQDAVGKPAESDVRRRRGRRRSQRRARPRSSTFSSIRKNISRWARAFPKACCCSARPAPAKRCWRGPSPAKRACRSSRFPAPISSRCSSASARPACATSSIKPRSRRRASCSSTRSTPSAASAAPAWAAVTTSASKRSTSCSSRWTASIKIPASFLIAATNRADVLDPALLRPGRFDRQIVVDRADFKGREKILEVHARNKPLGKEVSLETLAKRTPGFSGADLENLLNEAALLAARRNKNIIEMIDCDEAIDRVMVGPERKSVGHVAKRERTSTAYHESGHAIIGGLLDKVRSGSQSDDHSARHGARNDVVAARRRPPQRNAKKSCSRRSRMALGGRLAEEIKFGDVTTGASNDFEKATELARRMVTQYGMSDLGPIQFGRGSHQVFLGRDFGDERNYSEEVASKIDGEVRKIIEACYEHGKQILDRELGQSRAHGRVAARVRNGRGRRSRGDRCRKPVRSQFRRGSRPSAEAARRTPGRRRAKARSETVASSTEDFAGTCMNRATRVRRRDARLGIAATMRAPSTRRLSRSKRARFRAAARTSSIRMRPSAPRQSHLWFRAPAAGYDDATPGIASLAATAAAVTPLASGKSLYATRFTPSAANSTSKSIPISSASARRSGIGARRVVAAMTAAYFAPSIDDARVKTAQATRPCSACSNDMNRTQRCTTRCSSKFSRRAGALSAAAIDVVTQI